MRASSVGARSRPAGTPASLEDFVRDGMLARNAVAEACFAREAPALAIACQEMAARFLRGGRLLAFGRGACATDAQHVAVEFVHPVIVGKRALPALDLSAEFASWTSVIGRPDDMAIGFGPPGGDTEVGATLAALRRAGLQTFALPGAEADYALTPPSDDPFVHQEIVEILYHTLWETVHVFFEHRSRGHDVGDAGFLYPYLGRSEQDTSGVLDSVAASIREKAEDDSRLRTRVAREQSGSLATAAEMIAERVRAGGKLLLFGNGGSATDANDLAIDCVAPPKGYRPIPALSLSLEPATISAVANDIGPDAIFLRQLIAHAAPEDVAVAFSTSGSSRNVVAALEEARRRGLATLALVGDDGGEVARRGLADHALVVPTDYIPRIQEVHASVYHVLRDAVDRCLDG
ncbi:MAG: SIS domain-containing protein [Gemmatimonadaceae bacterium]